MNKLIIILFGIFTIINYVKADDFLEKKLELNFKEYKLQLDFRKLNNFTFKDKNIQEQFNYLKKVNPIIKKAIVNQYKKGIFSYYQTNSAVREYNNFIYYTNKYFKSIKIKEIYGNSKENNRYIYENFYQMKISYNRFKNIIRKK